jgi:hypothetical protein
MKKIIMISLILLFHAMAVMALPLSFDSKICVGKFEDSGGFEGEIYQCECGLSGGGLLQVGMGVTADFGRTDKYPSKIYGWYDAYITNMTTIYENRHMYSYGGKTFLRVGKEYNAFIVYKFKKVQTYYSYTTRTYFYDSTYTWEKDESYFQNKFEPAYEISIGLEGMVPKTPIFVTIEKSLKNRIWNVDRSQWSIGIGYKTKIADFNF